MRAFLRLIRLVFAVLFVLAVFGICRLGGRISSRRRAEWLHWACKFVLRNVGIRLLLNGTPPQRGLAVSNHLSYLDILLYGAAMPCVFVSKREVRSWPLFGLAASCAGTIFIDRSSKASAADVARRMQSLLSEGIPVLLFPEGTSTDGSSVLKFHPTLFEPAITYGIPVSVSAIRYLGTADYQERDLCYYGDIHFAPHIIETMGKKNITARIDFSSREQIYSDRRVAAGETRQEVIALREEPV